MFIGTIIGLARKRLNRIVQGDDRLLLGGFTAYVSAELIVRIVRVAAILVIARQVDALILGVAALALTLFELVRVLANAGIGQKIIAAQEVDLPAICNTAYRLFWIWCGIVALVQAAVAAMMAFMFGQSAVAAMLALLCGVYAIMPFGLVQVFLLMRAGKLQTTARITASQTIADHILTALLVLIWPSAWAVVLPKLLTAPVWLLMVRRACHWRRDSTAGHAPVASFAAFGTGVLITEIGTAARIQLDKLIIGALLGVEALGLYYFAFNAGLGITGSLTSAYGTVLYPFLCRAKDRLEGAARYRRGIMFGGAILVPLILLQVVLADLYVPIIFGAHWSSAAPLVSLLGLAALAMLGSTLATTWLRATGRTGRDAAANFLAGTFALGGLALGAGHGIDTAALGYVAGLSIILIPFFAWIALHAARTVSLPISPKEYSI
ncbi:oligosaccharide flippase family protein [Parasphingopyxis algicola]|uniref:oligosaccharide flippase family protein n=1 Tax=Parasphingopyxis algicola TaxID=2026624 RepID=UPI0015A448A6|nr:oligosaccharide flippase family protein [Parasphingopyxis algicola]QLC25202.1 oligosaccharide flippase family protein [Parasphingopyxis algicola]